MKFKSLLLALAFVPAALVAAERNDVPSCYAQAKIEQFRSAPSGRMLTVVVDQTTPLTPDLQKTAWGHIKRFLQPGDKLRLYSFSAYLEGHYTRLQFAGELEKPIAPARNASFTAAAMRVITQPSGPEHVRLSIWSDGPPLEATVLRHLFEPFFSSESRSSGLGLFICRELCQRYGAHIAYQRTQLDLREGNEFFVLLPLATPAPRTRPPHSPA